MSALLPQRMAAVATPMQGSLGHIIWTFCYLSVLIGLSAYGVHRYFIIYLYLKNRNNTPVPSRYFEQLPKVTVQLPIFNEVYVAERLLRSVSELDYPQELLQIQVLDDSTDETREITASCAEELRQCGFNVQLIHRVDRSGFKAGALSAGLTAAEGEFLCILDADFVPERDLLKRTIHFFTDPKVGMIQTRWGHLNRGYSLLTRMQAIFLDGHLLLEQTARSRSGRFFNFNGTAGLWRRSCIESSGGWQHDTLCEDLDLSYRAQLAGWKFFYLWAQRELHPLTWIKEILYLPCLLALGIGLSLNNARAVLEALINHKSDFTRTPKYGIERKSQSWRSCRYRPVKPMLPLAELGFAIYFTYFLWFAITHGQFLSVPFLLMFQCGFFYVFLASLASRWPKITFGGSRAAAAIPA